ncbi:MAG: YihY/virulence factor BrkB family protein [Mycobacteriales bacterium]
MRSLLSRLRRRPLLDHLVRTVQRYQADTGDRLAASVTFYWFLSLFPILLIAVYVTSRALGADAGSQVTDSLKDYLGTGTAGAVGNVVQNSAGKAGLLGLAGTLLSGLGWIDALREAIRTLWHQNIKAGNIVTRKVADVVALVGLFAVIGGSVFLSTAATAASSSVLTFLGLSDSTGAAVFTAVLSYVLGALVDVLIFLYLFVRLAKVPTPMGPVLRGAVFGAVGFEVVKALGAFYITRTTTKGEATYGTFAVVVGLLLFLNLVSRLVLLAAAFVVTAPYDDDVAPSGTADPQQARRAGIPVEYAETDLNVQEDGAPTPLRGALQGDPAEPGEDRPGRPAQVARRQVPPPVASGSVPGSEKVQVAATATAAAGGAVLAAVGIYGLRTVQGLLRR